MKDKLDKYFKQKLETSQQPPKDAWEYIQNQLPKKEEKKRVFPFWIRLSGIAVTLLLMVGFGYWLGTLDNTLSGEPEFVVNPDGNSENPHSRQQSGSVNEQNFEGDIPNYLSPAGNALNANTNSPQAFSVGNPGSKVYSYSDNSRFSNYYNGLNQNPNTSYNKEIEIEQKLITEGSSDGNYYSWNNFDLNPVIPLTMPDINDAQLVKNSDKEFLFASNDKPEKEKKKKKYTDFDRFYIAGFVSPLAFNTFVGNSMLADEMSQYNTENSVTLAYGIKAAYSVSPKLKVRTGVSVIGLEQITNGVPLAVEITGRNEFSSVDRVNNIKYNGNVMIDNHSMAASLAESETIGKMGYGDIQQQTSYIEIPLEAELSLFQTNSIGISATGGGSTWLLSKNKIYVHTDDHIQELGEASNLNNVSFSANAGLKFDMNLTENVKLNVEPNFRYLINPVKNIEKYNPYTVGVNAGISVSLK